MEIPSTLRFTQTAGAVVVVSNVSLSLIAENLNRRLLVIKNLDSAETVHLSFDATAATTSDWPLPPGDTLVLARETDGAVFTGEVLAIRGGAADVDVSILEFDL